MAHVGSKLIKVLARVLGGAAKNIFVFFICVIFPEFMFTFEGGHKTKSPRIIISLLFGVFHDLAFLKDSFKN